MIQRLSAPTGAILVTPGHEHAGLLSNDGDPAAKLLAAGERLRRLPTGPAHETMIESRFAKDRRPPRELWA